MTATLWTGVQVAMLLAIALRDLRTRTIPNRYLALAALCGAPRLWQPGVLPAMGGLAAGLAIFLALYLIRRGKLGEADVKLAGVIGLYSGWPLALTALTAGVVLGGAWALGWLLVKREREFPYAPALAMGAMIVLILDAGGWLNELPV